MNHYIEEAMAQRCWVVYCENLNDECRGVFHAWDEKIDIWYLDLYVARALLKRHWCLHLFPLFCLTLRLV